MHVRKVAVERNSSTGAGSQGDATKQSAANGRAGLNTCATTQARGSELCHHSGGIH